MGLQACDTGSRCAGGSGLSYPSGMAAITRTALIALASVGITLMAGCDREKPMVGEVPVHGMVCESCTQALTHQLGTIEGVESCEVSLESEMATVEYDGNKVEPKDLVEAIEAIGYVAGEPSVRPRS